MSATICPCCGYDIENDEPATFGGISMVPYGNAWFNGGTITLSPSESGVLWALVKARGRPLLRSTLAERIGYEGDWNVVDVMLTRIRQKLALHGEVPIKNRRGVGLYIDSVSAAA